MSTLVLGYHGAQVVCPARVLCDRADGGHLVVHPPRPVWERSALAPAELVAWSLLVAATGQAMLETLPALRDGCLNYWEAGNWSLHDQAHPFGPKDVRRHRRVHLHVFGRSRRARDPDWRWGESPRFPPFAEAERWSARFAPLTADECAAVGQRIGQLLDRRWTLAAAQKAARR